MSASPCNPESAYSPFDDIFDPGHGHVVLARTEEYHRTIRVNGTGRVSETSPVSD